MSTDITYVLGSERVTQTTKAEDRRLVVVLCLHAICPQGFGTHAQRSGSFLAILYSQDSLQPFSRWITALCALRPSGKSKRSSFLRVYSHD